MWFWKRESQQVLPAEETSEINHPLNSKLETIRLWESFRSWFLEKGYTLFQFVHTGKCTPLLDTPPHSGEYPYAFCGGDLDLEHPLYAYNSTKIIFAQDIRCRHVAIKKLNKPDEIRICRFLFEKQELLPGTCILPILEILEHEEDCFAVMPRWGEDPCFPMSGTIGNILDYINCLLKAINFLHSNSIVHRDLKEDNVLVNHFGAYRRNASNEMRPELRSTGLLTYALFDFDLALMLPSNDFRLPADRSSEVLSVTWTYGTFQGELDYDPYKIEMGCFGVMLCQMFQHCIPLAHFLAPFLDQLITHKLELRLTAQEALQFFEQMRSKLTPEQLSVEVPVDDPGYPPWEPEMHNRWENLPAEFVKEWGHLKAPIPSLYTKFLRRFCAADWCRWLVMAIRRVSRFLTPCGLTFSNYVYLFWKRIKI